MLIFKIVDRDRWETAESTGEFTGAEIDLTDGYIHFSTADQVVETAAKHFAGQADLLLVAVDSDTFGDALKWEPSRGGDLFPHLYSALKTDEVIWVREMPIGNDGTHQISLD